MSASPSSFNEKEENDNALQLNLYPPGYTPPPPYVSTITPLSLVPWVKQETGLEMTDEELAIILFRSQERMLRMLENGMMTPERHRGILEFIRVHNRRVRLYRLGRLSPEELIELNQKHLILKNFLTFIGDLPANMEGVLHDSSLQT